ncbi:MAG: UDP-N-acetylmuramoyl-L-alanyl-D-glutamate--2,6-diaminopimelate ligase [Coriobacteriia bacterium]|nr:UDP-N-acetylmuramoyl-L-alanyl-D-glutamate--2,6-diaminopimelate ligase [Coriobacteriia bacterium]
MGDVRLDDLLAGAGVVSMPGEPVSVSGIAYRSDRVSEGDAFFCIPGFAHDGHDFAADAVARGARAVVAERPLPTIARAAPVVVVRDAREALALASARFFGDPSRTLPVIGVTGTNGKTTTTYIVDSIMRAAGHETGIIGTVEVRIGGERVPSGRTTPESRDLQELLAKMRSAGVERVAMEVSSHAIDLKRVVGIRFAVAAFTNLTQDHLDYHKTLEEYWSVKRRLFTEHDVGVRVANIDDAAGAELASGLPDVIRVGRSEGARVRAIDETHRADGTEFELVTPSWRRRVRLPLPGAHNVENALVATGCALALGVDVDAIVAGLEACPQVPGRLERIDEGQPFSVLVDYAHTPDSLAKAIEAVREVTSGRVIVVFGCGGDRDREKRPLMGAAAGARADVVIATSDNPRSEDPVGIILQIEDGLREAHARYQVEVDRRAAIRAAIEQAQPGDAVLIAGKGHEDYQIFLDRTIHFDDREVAREELRRLC